MTRRELKRLSREQLKHNLGTLFLCTLIVTAINFALTYFAEEYSIISLIATLIIVPPLSLGSIMLYLDVVSGRKPQVATLFLGFNQLGQAALTFLLLFLMFTVYALIISVPISLTLYPALTSPSAWWPFILCYIFFLILTIILILPFCWVFYVMAEQPEFSAVEVLKESYRIMKGHKWEFILLRLSFLPWLLPIGAALLLGMYYFILAPSLFLAINMVPVIPYTHTTTLVILALVIIAVVFNTVYLSPYIALADTNFYCMIRECAHQNRNNEIVIEETSSQETVSEEATVPSSDETPSSAVPVQEPSSDEASASGEEEEEEWSWDKL